MSYERRRIHACHMREVWRDVSCIVSSKVSKVSSKSK